MLTNEQIKAVIEDPENEFMRCMIMVQAPSAKGSNYFEVLCTMEEFIQIIMEVIARRLTASGECGRVSE